jgi:hypothetical protein
MMFTIFRRGYRSILTGIVASLLLSPAICWARTAVTVPYPIKEVWPSSVRFIRVDRNFPIHEKDDESGYILFDFTDGPKLCKGALELIETTDSEGREATKVVFSIPDLPRRFEQTLIDKLAAKLRDDRGPPAPPPRKPAPTKPDAAAPVQPPFNPAQLMPAP